MVVCSVMMLICEAGSRGATIHTADDALWWAFSTVSAVGYGDCYPVTPEGRMVAAILMTVGVGLFSTLTVYIAAYFLRGQSALSSGEQRILDEVRTLRDEVAALRNREPPDRPA
jgi:voltage-gated potassium channel